MRNTPCKATVVALTLVIATGCSFGFLYRQLDWIVPWYVDDYITLNDTQRSVLEQRIMRGLEWHCRTQLTRYAQWMERLYNNPQGFTRSKLEQHYETTRRYWRDLMEQVAVDASEVLVSANEAQLEELVTNLERKNRKQEREYGALSGAQREQEREKKVISLFDRWLGDTTEAQRQAINSWSGAIGSEGDRVWMAERRRWQQLLIDVIRRHDEAGGMAKEIRVLLVEPETLWSEQYRREYQRRLGLTLDMLAAVAASMTPSQREHLDRELLSWAAKFDSLACAGEEMRAADG